MSFIQVYGETRTIVELEFTKIALKLLCVRLSDLMLLKAHQSFEPFATNIALVLRFYMYIPFMNQ